MRRSSVARTFLVARDLREYRARGVRVEFLGCRASGKRGIGPNCRIARKFRRFRRDGLHLAHVAIAMKDDIAPAVSAARPFGDGARQGIHRNVVGHQQASKSDKAANHLPHHCDRSGGRRDGVEGSKHNMCGHAERQACERAEGCKVGLLKGLPVRIDHWKLVMAILICPTMAWEVLENRKDTPGLKSRRDCICDSGDLAASLP